MTDRVRTLTVTLDRDMRDDDVQAVVEAIRMVRHVADVSLGPVVDSSAYYAKVAFRQEVGETLIRLIDLATVGVFEPKAHEVWRNIRDELERLVQIERR